MSEGPETVQVGTSSRSLKDRLARLQQSVQSQKVTEPKVSEQTPPDECLRSAPNAKGAVHTAPQDSKFGEAGLLSCGFEYVPTKYGSCVRRVLPFDVLSSHGTRRFHDLLTADLEAIAALSKIATITGVNHVEVEQFRFYDTETTGLGTGAGTVAFLHTVGRFVEDEFWLYQYFVDEYAAEAAVLTLMEAEQFVCQEDQSIPIIVSFNGKSFDWPLLQNRRILHSLPPLERFLHVDLLHPSRRLWKTQFPSVRLIDIEQRVLGLARIHDLPGSEAPLRYFQYIDSLSIETIQPVFDHNAKDVCSLVVLLAEFADILLGKNTPKTAQAHVAIATWFDEWSQPLEASQFYQSATEQPDADWKAFWKRSLFAKRQRRFPEAVALWTHMEETYSQSLFPLVELAKYAEHHIRDYPLATRWTEKAILQATDPKVKMELQRRLLRVERKQSRRLLPEFLQP
jgi:uncharacterized protein